MASKKRKTLQIKRPNANKPASKKKSLPNVGSKDNDHPTDTEELDTSGTEQAQQAESQDSAAKKAGTTRVALPNEDKIRKARRANATQDLVDEDALPSAEQIERAQKGSTMPIMIDTEDVKDAGQERLDDQQTDEQADRTMEIDAEALQTGNMDETLSKAESQGSGKGDQTMQIDPDALATGDVGEELENVGQGDDASDQTMKIDPASLATGNVGEQLEKADQDEEGQGDQTMQIDPESLSTGNIDKVQKEALLSQETMQMDALDPEETEKALNAETTAIEDPAEAETDLTADDMKQSFNAQTMAMDAEQIKKAADEETQGTSEEEESENLDQTMDLTQDRPKTIMIKRPSKQAGSSTPTVKAVRPDAPTVRTARPVTASPSSPKEGTSRVDIPEGETSSKEGKTIKLRRPGGTGSRPSSSPASRVAGSAGLSMGADGTVRSSAKASPVMGGGWLAVAIITFLISLGAVWSLIAISQPELPMPGRLVNAQNQLIPPTN